MTPPNTMSSCWQNGQMTDLNTQLTTGSAWLITSANAIHERGDIAAVGMIDGQSHGVVLVVKSGALWESGATRLRVRPSEVLL